MGKITSEKLKKYINKVRKVNLPLYLSKYYAMKTYWGVEV
jgi:hypothetical protein